MSDFLLLESSSLRKQLCTEENTSILKKVGQLIMLPETAFSTTENVASFFCVPTQSIKNIVFDHREELTSDGYKVLSSKEFRELLQGTIRTKARKIAIFPRRAVLRLAMILHDSEVAKSIRTYLLNQEKKTPSMPLIQVAKQLELHATQLSLTATQLITHSHQINQQATQVAENAKQLVAQSRLISAVANEIYRIKENQKKVTSHFINFKTRLEILESQNVLSETISKQQIKDLKNKVKKIGHPIQVWKKFNTYFGISRYIHLPKEKYNLAIQWIDSYR